MPKTTEHLPPFHGSEQEPPCSPAFGCAAGCARCDWQPGEDRSSLPTVTSCTAGLAVVAIADQLRAYAGSRTRDRLLVDVLAVDLLAVALWLERRAFHLTTDPDELRRLLPQLIDVPGDVLDDAGWDEPWPEGHTVVDVQVVGDVL